MTDCAPPDLSGYSDLDRAGRTHDYVRRLDGMRADPFWASVKAESIALLDLHVGENCLDVGCGTGDDVLTAARSVGPRGRAVGVDVSNDMVSEARRRAAQSGLAVEFQRADASQLPFANATFDACRAERILQHLDNPRLAVAEIARVTRPSGRLVFVEPDYATLSVEGADPELTREIVRVRCAHFRAGRVGSQLPQMCKRLGLLQTQVQLRILATSNFGHGERGRVQKYAESAVQWGALSKDDARRWLAQLEVAATAGRYRHALAVFVVRTVVPGRGA